MTAASIAKSKPQAHASVSPIARLGVIVVALAASVVFTAAAVLFVSALFSFPVVVPVDSGEVLGARANSLWWLDAIGALLCATIAVAAVVEAIRLVRPAD